MSDHIGATMNQPQIIYQDKQILVINKPAGMVANRAESVKTETVQDWVEGVVPLPKNVDEIFKSRSGLAHRLDKDTSGVMLIAKTPEALMELMRQFKDREVEKTYLALVHGKLDPKEGNITLPLGRMQGGRHKFGVDLSGKVSKTSYKVKKHYQGYSLVELYPKTGRTHQIRVVLKHLGHPIVGDTKYVGRKRAKTDSLWCKRQFLHAAKITFAHPKTKKRVTFEAELAEDLKTAKKKLIK